MIIPRNFSSYPVGALTQLLNYLLPRRCSVTRSDQQSLNSEKMIINGDSMLPIAIANRSFVRVLLPVASVVVGFSHWSSQKVKFMLGSVSLNVKRVSSKGQMLLQVCCCGN